MNFFFLIADIYASIYAQYESLFYLLGSLLVEIQWLSELVLLKNWFGIVIHASSFAPLMDAICPRRFLIECVDAK